MPLKYLIVAEDIERQIREGACPPQSKLPTTDELCEQYGVSRITVRKAMDVLSERGFVIKRRGSGTYVKDIDPSSDDSESQVVESYSATARHEGHVADTQVLEFQVIPAEGRVAERLRVEEGTPVYSIVRLRSVNDSQGLVSYTWIPVAIVPNLTKRNAADSLYRHVEVGLGLTVSSTHRSIRAVMPTLEEQVWLRLPEDVPVLEIDQVTFLSDGRLFEYSVLHRDTRDWSFKCVNT